MAIDQSEIQKKQKEKRLLTLNMPGQDPNATPPPLPQPGALPPPPPIPAPLTLTPPQPDTAEAPRPFDAVAQMFPVAPKQQVAADVTNSPQAAYDKAKADSTAKRAGSLDSDSWRTFMGGVKKTDPNAQSYSGRVAAGVVAGAEREEAGLQQSRRIAEELGQRRDVGMAQAEAIGKKAEAPIAVQRLKNEAIPIIEQGKNDRENKKNDTKLAAIDKVAAYKTAIADSNIAAKTGNAEAHDQTLRDLSAEMTQREMARLSPVEKNHALQAWQKQLMLYSATPASQVDKVKLEEAKSMVDSLLPRGQTAAPAAPVAAPEAAKPNAPAGTVLYHADGRKVTKQADGTWK